MTYQDLKILYEDNHIIVVMKPANIPVQKDESEDEDMLTLLKRYLVEKYKKPGEAFLGLVHRLDRPTGGVMVFAKTSKAASRLSDAIREGRVDKRYLAIVEGTPREKAAKLINYLKKFPENNTVKVVPQLTEGAKYAELDYRTLESKDKMSLLQVDLVTGRAHQIRVQLSNLGNPIVGDQKYHSTYKCQMCLWAVEIRFAHPISGKSMLFRVYPPEMEPWTKFDIDRHLSIASKSNIYEDEEDEGALTSFLDLLDADKDE